MAPSVKPAGRILHQLFRFLALEQITGGRIVPRIQGLLNLKPEVFRALFLIRIIIHSLRIGLRDALQDSPYSAVIAVNIESAFP